MWQPTYRSKLHCYLNICESAKMRVTMCFFVSLNELRINLVSGYKVVNETLCVDLKTKSDCNEAWTGCLLCPLLSDY